VPVCLAEFVTLTRQGGLSEACTEETLMVILFRYLIEGFENNRFGTSSRNLNWPFSGNIQCRRRRQPVTFDPKSSDTGGRCRILC
jgi:hypothetical protein